MSAAVSEVIKAYGITNGYGGLYSSDGKCACTWDELAPCGYSFEHCEFGYKREDPTGEYDFIISSERVDERELAAERDTTNGTNI